MISITSGGIYRCLIWLIWYLGILRLPVFCNYLHFLLVTCIILLWRFDLNSNWLKISQILFSRWPVEKVLLYFGWYLTFCRTSNNWIELSIYEDNKTISILNSVERENRSSRESRCFSQISVCRCSSRLPVATVQP